MCNETEATAAAARGHYLRTHLARAERWGETPSLVWARTGARHAELNRVLWFTADDVPACLELMDDVPALWSLWPGTEGFADVEAAMRESGLAAVEEEPLMTLPLARWALPTDDVPTDRDASEVTIQACRSLRDLDRWARFWAAEDAASEHLPGITAALAPFTGFGLPESCSAAPIVTHFLALHSGRVVGCSAAVVAGVSAAVEHVIVAAEWRSRRIGTRLTEAALDRAVLGGAKTCVLTASPEGEGLYRRLGFSEVCRVQSYGRRPVA